MACKGCAERSAQMKAWLEKKLESAKHWASVREGAADGKAKASARQAAKRAGETGSTAASGPAGEAGHEHQQRGMETDPRVGADAGRVPVPSVRKARGGKAGAR